MRTTDTRKLHNLPKQMYLEYIRLFPGVKPERVRDYTTLVLTLVAVIGFSVFAISPTLSTILELRRKLADSRFADSALQDKLNAMKSLQQQYTQLGSSLNLIDASFPTTPDVPSFLGKLQTVAEAANVHILKLESLPVELTKKGTETTPSSFVTTVTFSGSYDETVTFLQRLHRMDRIVSIDTLSIDHTDSSSPLETTLRLRVYFHPEAKP